MKLFLIDGHALIFKMYYAFLGRPMLNSKGLDTSILYGFTKYLLELIEREKPSHLAVSFDPPGGTFRNEMYPLYKANRSETPQLVIDALEPLTKICKALEIPVLMLYGYEADDVIGSMAKRASQDGFEVYMVTPDKDYGQLVENTIFQYKPGKSGTDNEILGPKEICEKWGIDSPDQVIDILTLCGDSADNVPGVDGVGPVGASKLLSRYGETENIYRHLDELTPKMRERFEAAKDHIGLSKKLVTIKTDIEIDTTNEEMLLTAHMTPEVADIFGFYEFNSLKRFLSATAGVQEQSSAVEIKALEVSATELEIRDCCALAKSGEALWVAKEGKVASGNPDKFKDILENGNIAKFGYGLKEMMSALAAKGIELKGRLYDIELMHYLLGPERSHSKEMIAQSMLGISLEQQQSSAAPEQASLFADQSEDSPQKEDLGMEAACMWRLGQELKAEMEKAGIGKLYEQIEEPLIGVLSRMERSGVKVDVSTLNDYAQSLRKEMLHQEALVRDISQDPGLNVSSPKQLGELLFEKMKIDPKAKKPAKGSWPTDEATLLELSDRSPIIDAILEFRGLKKLLGTYIEPFPSYISPADGRVHTTFNQALTATGRLSSSSPNLQNIPIRTEQGREIRKAFVADGQGSYIMSADYSQIELRLMAHFCGDEHMLAAFRSGQDVHAATAAKIFKVALEDVTAEQRRVAKTANFGIMYGISAFGLAQRLKCSRSEAKQIIDDYFESFPSIRGFIDRTLQSARENGYVQTLFGRRRYVPDVNAGNAQLRALAERNAVNAPIQGTAADIIKLAMIGVDRALSANGLQSKMVLQIHDELLLEVPQEELEQVRGILISEMENVMELSVPLTVECNYGKNWLEAH